MSKGGLGRRIYDILYTDDVSMSKSGEGERGLRLREDIRYMHTDSGNWSRENDIGNSCVDVK